MLLTHAVIPGETGFEQNMCIRLTNGTISQVGQALAPQSGEAVVDLAGDYLLPGFVDVHIHAFMGHDTMQGEAAVREMSRGLYAQGVAAFLPTTMSASAGETRRAVAGIRAVMDAPEQRGAQVLGAHMEAPFLNPQKCGAQRAECLMLPDWQTFLDLTGGDISAVRTITVAPELTGAGDFIRQAVQSGIAVSLGHSAADAATAHAAADWGASRSTHTFNAQPPLHHREPGLVGAALADERLYAEFIADGVHLHRDIVRLIARCKGAERAVAITDAMEAAGLPDGHYSLGGQPVTVRSREARLADGTLAGSVLTMPQALTNLIHLFGIPPFDAVRMCTRTPAESIGEHVLGRIVPGSPAPLTHWSADWQLINVIGE